MSDEWDEETLSSILGEDAIKVFLALGLSERSDTKPEQLQHDLPARAIQSSLRTLHLNGLITKRGKKWMLTDAGGRAWQTCLRKQVEIMAKK